MNLTTVTYHEKVQQEIDKLEEEIRTVVVDPATGKANEKLIAWTMSQGSRDFDEAEALVKEFDKRLIENPHEAFKWAESRNPSKDLMVEAAQKMLIIWGYQQTLTHELVKVTKRYVISDTNLISPAGISPLELVFVKNEVWIEADTIPHSKDLPNGKDLKVFDIQREFSEDRYKNFDV
tara:strand:- start:4450 stop:4983 length:534 start_codon:yes stop_codon:yes gene_type:complete